MHSKLLQMFNRDNSNFVSQSPYFCYEIFRFSFFDSVEIQISLEFTTGTASRRRRHHGKGGLGKRPLADFPILEGRVTIAARHNNRHCNSPDRSTTMGTRLSSIKELLLEPLIIERSPSSSLSHIFSRSTVCEKLR